MPAQSTVRFRLSSIVVALGASLAAPLALAANAGLSESDINVRYQADVERCNTGQTNQDRATCLQEAGAALEEARRNRLTNEALSPENKTKRCDALPAAQRDDCMLQMSGQDTTVEGSVEGGGILRETVITIPGETTYTPAPASPGLTPTPPVTPAPSLAPAVPPASVPPTAVPPSGSGQQ